METISKYTFTPDDLNISKRKNGISAFMRIRNGADFLEPTIRSHINHFDEIIAVYNQCTDATPDILGRLGQEYGTRLRIFHYTDRVFPPGSQDHASTPPDSPNSLVNYYNFALSRTSFRTVTKLDDDHIALAQPLSELTSAIRKNGGAGDKMLAFSGMNLWRNPDKSLAICTYDPISGGGDIGFFDTRADRFYTHDKRFERGPRAGLTREFSGFLYWHLKYLKPGIGFENYELNNNPNSRYLSRKAKLDDLAYGVDLRAIVDKLQPSTLQRLRGFIDPKQKFINTRNIEAQAFFASLSVEKAVKRTVLPEFQNDIHCD
jgi:hypothetical protein